MSTFVIANKRKSERKPPHLYAEGTAKREAIAVFTSAPRAKKYLRRNHLADQYEVREISAFEFIGVILAAQQWGVPLAAINPESQPLPGAIRTQVLPINARVVEFAAALTRDILRQVS